MAATLLRDFLCSFIATVFFAVLFSAPRRAVFFSAFIAAVGWVIASAIRMQGLSEYLGYFVGMLFVSVFSELGARHYRMPSIIIFFPALIPFIPGFGIYNSMFYLVTKNYDLFIPALVQTLLTAASIAVAMAVVNIFFSLKRKKESTNDRSEQ